MIQKCYGEAVTGFHGKNMWTSSRKACERRSRSVFRTNDFSLRIRATNVERLVFLTGNYPWSSGRGRFIGLARRVVRPAVYGREGCTSWYQSALQRASRLRLQPQKAVG